MSATASTNGNGTTAASASESPFAAESLYMEDALSPSVAFAAQTESPFTTEYGTGATAESLRAEAYASLVGELYSGEFENAVSDLVSEATVVTEQQFAWQGEDPGEQRAMAERALREYFAPLERESSRFIDRLASEAEAGNVSSMSEAELQQFLDRFELPRTTLSPSMEQFLGKFIEKAKKAVKGAVKVVKKGVALVNKLNPVSIVLGKLKALVRPLLERVLKFALDRLPVALRPVAATVANKLFGVKIKTPAPATPTATPAPDAAPAPDSAPDTADANTASAPTDEPAPADSEWEAGQHYEQQELEAAAGDTREIQEELDAELAGSMLGGEAFEHQLAIERMTRVDPLRDHAVHRLSHARRRFARRLLAMCAGQNPQAELEEFIPAILAAAKLGIKIIGRPKVVKFLAGLIAPLISKYAGRQPAVALSSALVDTGLRLMSLEMTPEDEVEAATNAVVSTVEGTVNRLLESVPEAEWGNESMLHGYVRGAFEQEASASFPDPMIRSELHETAELSGQWVDMPLKSPRKLYRKYSRVAEITITPQKAEAIKTFGGTTLSAFLRDRLGLPANRTVRAKVHLYEVKRGMPVGLITASERVPGLGHGRREARALLHPLTKAAAGLLLGEPKLGMAIEHSRLVEDRDRVGVRQRLYYLEIAGAHVRVAPSGRGVVRHETGETADHHPAHPSQGTIIIDVPKRELRVALFYAEHDAQSISLYLRKRAPAAVVLGAIRRLLDAQLRAAFARPNRSARLIHESVQTETSPSAKMAGVFKLLARPLHTLLDAWLADGIRKELEHRYEQFAQAFTKAAEADDDGVTVSVTMPAAPIIEPIKKILKVGLLGVPGLLRAPKPPSVTIEIKPGYVRL
jgi:hypothetical protein